MGWYITVTEEMRELGLSGNALLVFALICGYSQKRRGCYYGTIENACETIGISKHTAIRIFDKLMKAGHIEKVEGAFKDARLSAYTISKAANKTLFGGKKIGAKMIPR